MAAAHTERSTRWRRKWTRSPVATIAARPGHQQCDGRPAHDPVEIEQTGDQAARQRRRDGEEVNEVARQRIDRRPVDDRRIFRGAAEPAGVENHQQHDAGHRQQQAAEQPCPMQRPRAANPRARAKAARPGCRRGSARSDRAAPARRSPAAQTADRTTSACAVRARLRAQRPRSGSSRPIAAGVVSSNRPASIDQANHALRRCWPISRQECSSSSAHSGRASTSGPNSTPGELNAATVIVSSTASTACCPPTTARASR